MFTTLNKAQLNVEKKEEKKKKHKWLKLGGVKLTTAQLAKLG